MYVDTSYLSHRPKEQEADWNRLLLYAQECQENIDKDPKVEIHISRIAIEEYRTQSRDNLLAAIEKAEMSLFQLRREWGGNPIGKLLSNPIKSDIFPAMDKIESESQKIVEELLHHGVVIAEPQSHHGSRVWKNYFAWKAPFDGATLSQRSDKNSRDKRRKDIPDAWILEAALDILSEPVKLLCLCKDGNLSKALKDKKQCVYTDAAEILAIIDLSASDSILSTTDAFSPPDSLTDNGLKMNERLEADSSGVAMAIKNIQDEEKLLQMRILGYVNWFAPISKADLANLLQEKGHTVRIVNNVAERLALTGLIADTGNHYLPGNKAVCEQAANTVMSEILEILDT